MCSPTGTGVGVGVAVNVAVCVPLAVAVAVAVCVEFAVAVAVAVGVALDTIVEVAVAVGVRVGVAPGRRMYWGSEYGLRKRSRSRRRENWWLLGVEIKTEPLLCCRCRMTTPLPQSPGTVSRILWHFTGGPKWNVALGEQVSLRKPSAQAYENLKSILQTKELRVGNYVERIRVIIPKLRRYNGEKRKFEILPKVPQVISSVPVCCLSDIPAPHLGYHAYRYGKFAVGFHRSAAVRHGFNPVFYTLEDAKIIQSIYEGFTELNFVDLQYITHYAADIEDSMRDIQFAVEAQDADVDVAQIENAASSISLETNTAKHSIAKAQGSFREFLAFVKTFSVREFSTIYCEREWRSVKAFSFTMDDVAMIVVPRQISSRQYFAEFVRKIVPQLQIPPTVPVLPWEDLVEH